MRLAELVNQYEYSVVMPTRPYPAHGWEEKTRNNVAVMRSSPKTISERLADMRILLRD